MRSRCSARCAGGAHAPLEPPALPCAGADASVLAVWGLWRGRTGPAGWASVQAWRFALGGPGPSPSLTPFQRKSTPACQTPPTTTYNHVKPKPEPCPAARPPSRSGITTPPTPSAACACWTRSTTWGRTAATCAWCLRSWATTCSRSYGARPSPETNKVLSKRKAFSHLSSWGGRRGAGRGGRLAGPVLRLLAAPLGDWKCGAWCSGGWAGLGRGQSPLGAGWQWASAEQGPRGGAHHAPRGFGAGQLCQSDLHATYGAAHPPLRRSQLRAEDIFFPAPGGLPSGEALRSACGMRFHCKRESPAEARRHCCEFQGAGSTMGRRWQLAWLLLIEILSLKILILCK